MITHTMHLPVSHPAIEQFRNQAGDCGVIFTWGELKSVNSDNAEQSFTLTGKASDVEKMILDILGGGGEGEINEWV